MDYRKCMSLMVLLLAGSRSLVAMEKIDISSYSEEDSGSLDLSWEEDTKKKSLYTMEDIFGKKRGSSFLNVSKTTLGLGSATLVVGAGIAAYKYNTAFKKWVNKVFKTVKKHAKDIKNDEEKVIVLAGGLTTAAAFGGAAYYFRLRNAPKYKNALKA